MMFSDTAKRGNQMLIDIIDNGYIASFTLYDEGKEQRKKYFAQYADDICEFLARFNKLEKL